MRRPRPAAPAPERGSAARQARPPPPGTPSVPSAVARDGTVIRRHRLFDRRLPFPSVEQRLRQACPELPEPARRRQQAAEGGAREAALPLSVESGKNAAFTTPICALASATRRSAAAMSGRRSRSCEGSPKRDRRRVRPERRHGIEKLEAGLPISAAMACSSCARRTLDPCPGDVVFTASRPGRRPRPTQCLLRGGSW